MSAALKQEYPFAPHSHEVGGVRMNYVDEGQGQPALMIHGNPTWSFLYRNVIKDLSRDHRAIAVDNVGCGLSDKPQNYRYRLARHAANLEDFILAKDLRDIKLIVHDWGGPIGLSVATRHPDRFHSIVICNTAAYRSQRMPVLLKIARIPGVGEALVQGLNAFVIIASRTCLVHTERMKGAIKEGYFYPYQSWNNRIATLRFVQDVPMEPAHPSYGDLVELERGLVKLREKPIMLMWGTRDWCFGPHFRDRFLEFFPEARVVNFGNASHYLFEDEPQGTVAALREFYR